MKLNFVNRTGDAPVRGIEIQAVDALVFVYQALICLIVLLGDVPGSKASYWLAHAGFSVLLLGLLAWNTRRPTSLTRFLSANYPLIFITFFYVEAGWLVHAIFPGTLDARLWEWDKLFAGGGPALWAYQQENPPALWLTEFMHIGYSFFYFLMPLAALSLWLRSTRERHATFMFSLTLTYFTHYLLFIFLPAHSPRLYDPALLAPLPGYVWSDMLAVALKEVAYPGGSFPSSHVAASIICFMAWRAMGILRFPVLFMTLVMFAGTVYGRYHYVIDIVTGLLFGLLLYRLSPIIERRWKRRHQEGDRNGPGAQTRH
jgi:membrane-associated phospholipid phosphatase